jgi:hypothetical protein
LNQSLKLSLNTAIYSSIVNGNTYGHYIVST